MSQPIDEPQDKWGATAATATVRAFHDAIRARVAEKWRLSARSWSEFVFDPAFELGADDFAAVEHSLLDTGYRFEHSAQISVIETPEKYRDGAAAQTPTRISDDDGVQSDGGERVVGVGDNVFVHPVDVEGTVRHVSSVETVMEYLESGVPPGTIAVIDDAGGTLTAPILEGFAGILCLGGTIRSHLGILSREYELPCLMGVEMTAVRDGLRVRFESTKRPPDVSGETVLGAESDRARIWIIEETE